MKNPIYNTPQLSKQMPATKYRIELSEICIAKRTCTREVAKLHQAIHDNPQKLKVIPTKHELVNYIRNRKLYTTRLFVFRKKNTNRPNKI